MQYLHEKPLLLLASHLCAIVCLCMEAKVHHAEEDCLGYVYTRLAFVPLLLIVFLDGHFLHAILRSAWAIPVCSE